MTVWPGSAATIVVLVFFFLRERERRQDINANFLYPILHFVSHHVVKSNAFRAIHIYVYVYIIYAVLLLPSKVFFSWVSACLCLPQSLVSINTRSGGVYIL